VHYQHNFELLLYRLGATEQKIYLILQIFKN